MFPLAKKKEEGKVLFFGLFFKTENVLTSVGMVPMQDADIANTVVKKKKQSE